MTHISTKDMAPELRTIGTLTRPLLGKMNAKSFRRTQKFLDKTAKGRLPNDLAVEQRYITRPDGTRLRLLVVLPQDEASTATAVLWLHGGGYAIEVPELELDYARKIQQAINAVVVMPDYRLSIEAPFPAALNDLLGVKVAARKRRVA